ncbi:hypothetical protein CBR_g12113 [Chara braunii]|uniref:Uncharacterized protein n=1 Tax=Chara braunii TaxID=69332 RepID=A0A388KR89_CHABU|nr:hypothetical protein CBR_g12113 [Chara braunii]|eukprot:GBG72542.1 hypothetical protein CBR_g12113 [Chara braunii]
MLQRSESFSPTLLKTAKAVTRCFVWKSEGDPPRGFISKVAWHTICAPREEGGLSLIDPGSQNNYLLARWVVRVAEAEEVGDWILLAEALLASDRKLARPSDVWVVIMTKTFAEKRPNSRFWRDVLAAWKHARPTERIAPKSKEDVKCQTLFENQWITDDEGAPFLLERKPGAFGLSWAQKGISLVGDLWDAGTNQWKPDAHLREVLRQLPLKEERAQKLRAAIPDEWKCLLGPEGIDPPGTWYKWDNGEEEWYCRLESWFEDGSGRCWLETYKRVKAFSPTLQRVGMHFQYGLRNLTEVRVRLQEPEERGLPMVLQLVANGTPLKDLRIDAATWGWRINEELATGLENLSAKLISKKNGDSLSNTEIVQHRWSRVNPSRKPRQKLPSYHYWPPQFKQTGHDGWYRQTEWKGGAGSREPGAWAWPTSPQKESWSWGIGLQVVLIVRIKIKTRFNLIPGGSSSVITNNRKQPPMSSSSHSLHSFEQQEAARSRASQQREDLKEAADFSRKQPATSSFSHILRSFEQQHEGAEGRSSGRTRRKQRPYPERQTMELAIEASVAITAAKVQVLLRNRDEVDAFQELVEGYGFYLGLATEAAGRVCVLEKKLVQVQDDRDTVAAVLQRTERTIQRSPDIDALEAKVEALQQDLGQSYKASAEVSQQLVQASSLAQSLREELEEKKKVVVNLQESLAVADAKVDYLEGALKEKTNAVELTSMEAEAALRERIEVEEKLRIAEAENRSFVDKLMEFKLKEAEKINELNAMYEDMVKQFQRTQLQELARRSVDGVVRRSEDMAEDFMPSGLPSGVKSTTRVHDGDCSSAVFGYRNGIVLTGGMDRQVKMWHVDNMSEKQKLRGSLGSIMDIAISLDNKGVLGAGTDHKIMLWDVDSGRERHVLTGHTEKVCSVDFSKADRRRAVSSAYDRTINVWDLHRGYGIQTILTHSNCNALCLTPDGAMICTGHTDGHLRFWEMKNGVLVNEVPAHSRAITSISVSQGGTSILTNGRDNVLNVFDLRTFEARCTLRAPGYLAPSNWSRACMSPDDKYIAAGSSDSNVYVWSHTTASLERVLRGHTSPVFACAWCDLGRPLVSCDKNGFLLVWE